MALDTSRSNLFRRRREFAAEAKKTDENDAKNAEEVNSVDSSETLVLEQAFVSDVEPVTAEAEADAAANAKPEKAAAPEPVADKKPEMPNSGKDGGGRNTGGKPPAPAKRADAPPHDVEDSDDKNLIVGRGITLSGEISSCDELQVDGQVEANLSKSRRIKISESGIFKGEATVDEAFVDGTFEGTLAVNGGLTIRSSGRVIGDIRYGHLAIEPGGVLSGTVATASEG